MARTLRAAWIYDQAQHHTLNAAGRNYWHIYTEEVLNRLGLTADRLPPTALVDEAALQDLTILVVGRPQEAIVRDAAPVLRRWVERGGLLIAFATEGLEDLFGLQPAGSVEQPQDEFSISAYLKLAELPETRGIHLRNYADQPLIIISPVRLVIPVQSRAAATLLLPDPAQPDVGRAARPTDYAAVTIRQLGAGLACYFAFDLPQTMWTLHQGRPVDADYDGDGYLRSMDARLIGRNEHEVPYSDELHLLLQSFVGTQPMPLIHQIPPADGKVADALFYFGGDDEGQPMHQLPASDFMKARGLPYHINCMPVNGKLALGPEQIAHVQANGHELAVHYDFITGFAHPVGFTAEDVRQQHEVFRQAVGRPSVCSVNHWCRWTGWVEPARWMLAVGQLADNSWCGAISPPLNPVNNIDFSFGSAFPRRLWDDWRSGNERLDFVQEPIISYEVGYQGDETDFGRLHRAVDLAAHYRLTMNMFYHPVYIASYPACQQAIDELLRYIGERGIRPVFMGNDEVARWWLRRAGARIDRVAVEQGCVSFVATCDYPGGFVVKLCLGEQSTAECSVAGQAAEPLLADELGRTWAYLALPPGSHEVTVKLGPPA